MLSALGIFLASSALRSATEPVTVDGMLCHPQHVLVKYSSPGILKTISRRYQVLTTLPKIGWAVIETPLGKLKASKTAISSMDGVVEATYDRAARPAYDPNDELYAPNGWGLRAMKANLAWDITKGDPGVVVAVIDTGVRVNHPDLADNIWVNSGEIPGNGLDDDGNGYIDDVNGYDFAYSDSNPDDDYGHGTACAGLVGALQDNMIGCSGVAPHTKIMALKAALSNGYFYDSANAPAFLYAQANGAKVLSMSFFSDRVSQIERDAIDYCWTHGVLPIAAAGNSSSVIPYYPGAYENTLSVAALDTDLSKAGFSNYGSWVDVSAPGVSLATTTMDGGYTTGFSGTSGACPMVAGAAALCFAASPTATNVTVRNALEDTATLQSEAPFGEFANNGAINAEAAVQRILGASVTVKPTVVRYITRVSSTGIAPFTTGGARVYGRNLGQQNQITITSNGQNVPIARQGRNFCDIPAISLAGNITVKRAGTTVATFTFPTSGVISLPLCEASEPGATLTGGFYETLSNDGVVMTAGRRSDGIVLMQGTFRSVPLTAVNYTLQARRRYRNTTVGTETIYLYDWSSSSYPYGNWVPISTLGVMGSMTTTTVTVPNFSRFVDPEGTTYVLIQTSDDTQSGAKLDIDQIFLKPGT